MGSNYCWYKHISAGKIIRRTTIIISTIVQRRIDSMQQKPTENSVNKKVISQGAFDFYGQPCVFYYS